MPQTVRTLRALLFCALVAGAFDAFAQSTVWPRNLPPTVSRSEDSFGYVVSVSGNIMVATAPQGNQYQGRAFIFHKDGAGKWVLKKELTEPTPGPEHFYGMVAANDGNEVVIGAYGNNWSPTGKTYVYRKDQGGTDNWGLQKELPGNGKMSFVRIENGILVSDNKVYYRDQGGTNNWGLVATLTASPQFGIDIDGDYIFVGNSSADNKGRVYVYGRNQGGTNAWGLVKSIQPVGLPDESRFGYSLSVSNGNLIVGAYDEGPVAFTGGTAYFFKKDEGGTNNWGQVQKITDGNNVHYWYGMTVQVVGDHLYIYRIGPSSTYMILTFKLNAGGTAWIRQTDINIGNTDNAGGVTPSFQVTPDQTIYFSDFYADTFIKHGGRVVEYKESAMTPFTWTATQNIFPMVNVQSVFEYGHGYKVSIDGDWAAVAPYINSGGEVYVYSRSLGIEDGWGFYQRITVPQVPNHIQIVGDYIVVALSGELRVYKKNSTQFTLIKTILGTTYSTPSNAFANTFKFDGNTLVVADRLGFNSIYIFYKNQGGTDNFGFIKKITPPDGQNSDEYAANGIEILGSTIFVTAFADTNGALNGAGSVYVYEKDQGGADNWGQLKKILGTTEFGSFGYGIAGTGDYCWVSAAGLTHTSMVLGRNHGGTNNWGVVKQFSTSNFYGEAAMKGNYLVVTTRFGAQDRGSVGVYHKDSPTPDSWGLVYSYTRPTSDELFGLSVSATTNRFLIGAPKVEGDKYTGEAFLFPMPPAWPKTPTPSNITGAGFTLTWDAVDLADAYEVEIILDDGSYHELYTIQETTLNVNGLQPGLKYAVRIKATQFAGVSSTFNLSYVTTTPLAPTVQQATDVLANGFTANWTEASGATSYLLDVSDDNFATFVEGYEGLSVAATSAVVTALDPETTYKYRVRATTGLTTSVNSPEISVTTLPPAPIWLTVLDEDITATSIKIGWEPVESALTYELDVSANDFVDFVEGYERKELSENTTTEIVSDLSPKKPYKFRIRANSAIGLSAWSSVLTVATDDVEIPLAINTGATIGVIQKDKPVKLTVNVTGGFGDKTVSLYYRKIQSKDEFTIKEATLATNNDYEVEVVEAMTDEMGVEYYFGAVDDLAATVQQSAHSYLYKHFPANAAPSIPFANGFDGKQATYQMFSIPYELQDNDINKLFDIALGEHATTSWRLFHYANKDYSEYPNDFLEFTLGHGYWFNTFLSDFQVKLNEVSVTKKTHDQPFVLTLNQGWNQIGNPYPFAISWNAVKGDNTQVQQLNFYANGAYSTNDTFKPWTGAFVFADQAVNLPVPLSAKASGRIQDEEIPPSIDHREWILPIEISGDELITTSGIGMHPDASLSKDHFDRIRLPRFIDFIDMSTHHGEFFAPDFATDVIPTSDSYTWTFDVRSNLGKGGGKLKWNAEAIAGSSASLVLVNVTDEAWIDMKAAGSYSFDRSKDNVFKIIYDRDGEIDPGMTLLGAGYPNPFSHHVTIPMLIGENNLDVSIEVFNLLGQKLRTLNARFVKAGLNNLSWDGKDDHGTDIAAGVLFYRMSSRPNVQRIVKN